MTRHYYPGVPDDEWPTMVECPRCKGPQRQRVWSGTCWLCDETGFCPVLDAMDFNRMVREEDRHV